jgi:hypothetical protein
MLNQQPKIRLLPNRDALPITKATSPGKVETARKIPTSDLQIIADQMTVQNNQLRHELEYQKRRNGPGMYLLEEVRLVVNSLQEALINFEKLNAEFQDTVIEQ